MKNGWQTKTLGDVAEIGAGNSAPQAEALFENGTHPFFRTADAGRVRFGEIYESSDYLNENGIKGLRLFPKGTILFPKSGASTFLNHRVMLGVDGYVASHLATIVADSNQVDQGFLLYFLSTVSAQDLIQDHAYPSLNLPVIAGINIQVPPLSEQKQIVNVLDEVFEKTAKAKENAEKNLQNARELFESYLQSIFADPVDGWTTKTLGEVCDFEGGSQPPKDDFVYKEREGYIRLIQIRDYKTDAKKVYIPIKKAKRFCDENDIMIGRYGPPVFQILRGIKGAYNVALMKAIPKEEKITKEFIYFYLQHRGIQQYIINLSQRAVGQTGISKEDLEAYPIYFPNINKQCKITDSINALSISTKKLETIYRQKLTDLDELKRSILQKAFNGELAGACS